MRTRHGTLLCWRAGTMTDGKERELLTETLKAVLFCLVTWCVFSGHEICFPIFCDPPPKYQLKRGPQHSGITIHCSRQQQSFRMGHSGYWKSFPIGSLFIQYALHFEVVKFTICENGAVAWIKIDLVEPVEQSTLNLKLWAQFRGCFSILHFSHCLRRLFSWTTLNNWYANYALLSYIH